MKHPSSRELFRYWTELRGPRPAPQRKEIDPAAVRRVLGDSLILSLDPGTGHPIRLAGTRVCAVFCREIKDTSFLDLWDEESRPLLRSLLLITAEEAIGVVAGAVGHTLAEPTVPLEMLLLPVVTEPSLRGQLIGILAPLGNHFWIGVTPVEAMTLGAFRILRPEPPALARPSARGMRQLARFTVYDGGIADKQPVAPGTLAPDP